MAVTQVTVASPAAEVIYTNTALANAASAVKSSSTLLLYAIIDNTANGAASYVKLYNVASGSVTVGTTAPDEIFYVPAGVVKTYLFYTGAAQGATYGTALTACCVTAGGTAGTVSPSSSVVASFGYV